MMVSYRSRETADHFIADLVVGLGTGQIKTGALVLKMVLLQISRLITRRLSVIVFVKKKFKTNFCLSLSIKTLFLLLTTAPGQL